MFSNIKKNYQHTLYACFIGYIVQAIVNNYVPLLFLTLSMQYNISIEQISILISINFGIQLIVDLLSAKFIDMIGYKKSAIAGNLMSGIGLILFAFLPKILNDSYMGILISVIVYAIGGGLLEVIISPIVESSPTKRKEAAMSLLHSFYCWGHALVIILSTIFFVTVGIKNWSILACLWATIPILNSFYFSIVPVNSLNEGEETLNIKKLISNKTFLLMIVIMVCAGASEQAVSQWASTFAERGLGITKTLGDLTGPLAFALLMGSSRAIYAKYSEKFNLKIYMLSCTLLCLVSYLLISFSNNTFIGLLGCALCGFSVGVLWPGGFSIASKEVKGGGTAMFALLALAGDLGCSSGPLVVGFVADKFSANIKIGFMAAAVFPIILISCLSVSIFKKSTNA